MDLKLLAIAAPRGHKARVCNYRHEPIVEMASQRLGFVESYLHTEKARDEIVSAEKFY